MSADLITRVRESLARSGETSAADLLDVDRTDVAARQTRAFVQQLAAVAGSREGVAR